MQVLINPKPLVLNSWQWLGFWSYFRFYLTFINSVSFCWLCLLFVRKTLPHRTTSKGLILYLNCSEWKMAGFFAISFSYLNEWHNNLSLKLFFLLSLSLSPTSWTCSTTLGIWAVSTADMNHSCGTKSGKAEGSEVVRKLHGWRDWVRITSQGWFWHLPSFCMSIKDNRSVELVKCCKKQSCTLSGLCFIYKINSEWLLIIEESFYSGSGERT